MARLLPCKAGTLLEAGFPAEVVSESSCDVVDRLLLSINGDKLEVLVVSDCCADEAPLEVVTVGGESVMEGDDGMNVGRVDDNGEKVGNVGKVEKEYDDGGGEDAMKSGCVLVTASEPGVGPTPPYIDEDDTVKALLVAVLSEKDSTT